MYSLTDSQKEEGLAPRPLSCPGVLFSMATVWFTTL